MAGSSDESAGSLAYVPQHVGGRDHLATNDHLEAAAQLAVTAGDSLHGLVARPCGQPHSTELACRMCPHVAGSVENAYPEDG